MEFEKIFGPDGMWQELLQKAEGFIATQLSYESVSERRYKSFDHWRSHEAFEAFREMSQASLEEFERSMADRRLIERELLLGSFYIGEDEAGFDEGSGLVPA